MKRRLTARLGRVALAVAATASLLGCASVMTDRAEDCASAPATMPAPRRGALTEAELQMAQRAWTYFENNHQPATGFVNAVQDYPSTTMWDTASYIAALLAAHELGLIDKNRFDTRFTALMRTLQTMELFRNEQPNKVYNTRTAAKVDYANQPGEIGFSAIDMGRLLIWLKIVKERRPEHANIIDRFMLRLDFRRVVDWSGTLHGALLDHNKQVQYVQEGRLGYEEYAAKGFELWGFDASQALAPEPFDTLTVYGQAVPYDTRDPRTTNQHNYVVAESYVLDALELNWDQALDRGSDDLYHSQCWMADFGHRIYLAQEGRWRTTGILTARTEHQLDREPYFVYDTVFSDGFAWNTITDTGQHKPEAAAVSLKAALGMWVLWPTPYTEQLFDAIATAYDPNKGYFEGLYENGSGPIRTQTANNNGIMLEALLYKAQGKLLKWGPNDDGGSWEAGGADPFAGNDKGRPRFKREAQSFYKVGAPRSLDPGRTWRDNRKVEGVRQSSCGRCGSCANTVYPYSATWRVMPGR